jgi:CelD/BcsL family acetyltransferase involved in cellulose biosynthesis
MTTTARDLQIRAYRDLEDLQSLVPLWEDLLSAYPLATTFSTWEWLSSWWRNFGGGQQLFVVGVSEGNSRLIGLAPLSIVSRRVAGPVRVRELCLMGDGSGDSDNLDLPVRPGFEDQFAGALLECLSEHRSAWDLCRFNTLPPDSPAAATLLRGLHRRTWTVRQYERMASAIVMPDSWEAYLRQLPSEDQKNLERYSRRLDRRHQSRIYRCSREAELPACLEALFRLHQARWLAAGEPGSFSSEQRQKFYFDLSRTLLARGWLELWVLELGGTIAAVQYGFRYGSTVFQLQEGFDPAHSSDRVGFILRGHVMKVLIAEGVRKYDFLAGEPGYKARWGAQAGHYINLHFAQPYSLGSTLLRTLSHARQGKEWLRARLPKPAWQVLHKINLGIQGTSRTNSQDIDRMVGY